MADGVALKSCLVKRTMEWAGETGYKNMKIEKGFKLSSYTTQRLQQ